MSARRRQETIARFSVPIKPDTVTAVPPLSQATQQPTEPVPSQRSARRRTRSSQSILLDGTIDDDDDDDFVMDDGAGDDDDDDDSLDDENVPPTRTQAKNGKGKAAAKGKGSERALQGEAPPPPHPLPNGNAKPEQLHSEPGGDAPSAAVAAEGFLDASEDPLKV